MTAAQMGDHASLRGPRGEAARLAVQKLSTRDGCRRSCEPADSPFASTGQPWGVLVFFCLFFLIGQRGHTVKENEIETVSHVGTPIFLKNDDSLTFQCRCAIWRTSTKCSKNDLGSLKKYDAAYSSSSFFFSKSPEAPRSQIDWMWYWRFKDVIPSPPFFFLKVNRHSKAKRFAPVMCCWTRLAGNFNYCFAGFQSTLESSLRFPQSLYSRPLRGQAAASLTQQLQVCNDCKNLRLLVVPPKQAPSLGNISR